MKAQEQQGSSSKAEQKKSLDSEYMYVIVYV